MSLLNIYMFNFCQFNAHLPHINQAVKWHFYQPCKFSNFLSIEHSNKYHRAGAHCLIVEITPERLSDSNSLTNVFNRAKHFQREDYFSVINRIRREVRISDISSELAIEGLTLELLAKLDRRTRSLDKSGEPAWLKDARDFIHAHFKESISLSTVARIVDFHPSHVARVFRQKYNCSIGTYVRRLRLENAAEQLINTERSITEISHSAGFYDQSHFTSAFKLYTGTTPSKFRAGKN